MLAWHVEALRRQKKLPALRDLLSFDQKQARPTKGIHVAELAMLGEWIGVPVRRGGKPK